MTNEEKLEELKNHDINSIINEFLKNKKVHENDSFNVELLLKGDSNWWRFANVSAPTIGELFELVPQAAAKMEQINVNQECLQYLTDTDWYVTRFAETGAPVPQEILTARAEARAKIVK